MSADNHTELINVRDAIEEGRYKNTVPYTWTKIPVRDDMTVREAREHEETQLRLQREQRDAYRREDGRLCGLFRDDLEREHGVVGNPKADLLWQKAWEGGHANGFSEVCSHYENLVELITESASVDPKP